MDQGTFSGHLEFITPQPSADRIVEAIISVCALDKRDDIKYALLAELCDLLAVMNNPPQMLRPSK